MTRSAPLTLHGIEISTFTRTVMFLCGQKPVEIRLHVFDPYQNLGVTPDSRISKFQSAAHLEMHAWGKVPIMEHGDFVLIETSAICRYIDAVFDGPRFVPDDPKLASLVEQWISIVKSYIHPTIINGYVRWYLRPSFQATESGGKPPDRERAQAGASDVARDLQRLDDAYADRDWLVGNTMTLADMFVAPIVHTAALFPESSAILMRCANLCRMFAAVRALPGYVASVPPLEAYPAVLKLSRWGIFEPG